MRPPSKDMVKSKIPNSKGRVSFTCQLGVVTYRRLKEQSDVEGVSLGQILERELSFNEENIECLSKDELLEVERSLHRITHILSKTGQGYKERRLLKTVHNDGTPFTNTKESIKRHGGRLL